MTQAVPHIQNTPFEVRFLTEAKTRRVGLHTIVTALANRQAVWADRRFERPVPRRSAMRYEDRTEQLGLAGRHHHFG